MDYPQNSIYPSNSISCQQDNSDDETMITLDLSAFSPSFQQKTNIQFIPWLNIFLQQLIRFFSTVPHSLSAQFLAPYCLLLYLKKIACCLASETEICKKIIKESGEIDKNKQIHFCFCYGCSLTRKYRKFFAENVWKQQKINIYLHSNNLLTKNLQQMTHPSNIRQNIKDLQAHFQSVRLIIKGIYDFEKNRQFGNNLELYRSNIIFLMGIQAKSMYNLYFKQNSTWIERAERIEDVKQAKELLLELEMELQEK